jgi:MATE family multidrug resistance protein
MFLFAALRFALSALARTGRVMVITVAAVGLNYLLAMGLVHGRFGLPALGAPGAGWATTLVSWLMLGGLLVSVLRTPALAAYGLLRARLRIDVRLCAEIARLGIPVAGVVVLESGLFMAVSILSGAFGATALAAFQVLMGWIGIAFVIALGLAEGTMVRVALGMGRGSLTEARRAGLVGIGLGVALLGALVAVPLGVPELIVALFLQRSDPGYDEVARLVTGLLLIVALFQVFDAVQAIASRALRGMKDTVVPLLLAGFGYWVLGIGGGCTLAFPLGLQTHGLWWGTAAGLTVTGLLLAGRFVLLTRPRAPATPPGRAPARDQ